MNILFLAQNINIGSRTGDAVHVRELVTNLAKLGDTVSLFVWWDSQVNDLGSLRHPNINLYNTKYFNKKYFLLPKCLKVLLYKQHDVIYERCFSCKTGTVLSKLTGLPLVIEVNGLVDDEAKMQRTYKKHRLTHNVRKKFISYFLKSARKIVAVTSGIKTELVNVYNVPIDKIVIIPNGANTELFRPMCQESVIKELGLDANKKYVCFVGNLAPWQGVEYLIMAAPLVIKKVPDTRFLIVGDGMMYEKLRDLVKKSGLEKFFIFTGRIPYELVPKYISASDICVVPKKIIKSGYSSLKLYEYMASKKPVIATRTQGFEILEYYNAGLLVDPSNPSDFSNVIIRLILNDDLKNELGENGMKLVKEQFSWNITAKSISKVCKNLIN